MTKLKYIFYFLTVLVLVLCLGACSASADVRTMSISSKELLTFKEISDRELFYSDKAVKNLRKLTVSGVLEMYIDEDDLSVCILNTISGKLWRSLPYRDTMQDSANLTAEVIIKGRKYTLNSQRDSLSADTADYKFENDTLTLSYTFRKDLENSKILDITIPLDITLTDGTLVVNLDCSKITDNSTADVYISSVGILPFFGADNKGSKGDFIFLPSSSGVILDTAEATDEFGEITLPVYGEDLYKADGNSDYVPIGAFGMKNSDNAFLCLITEGEETAEIKAQKALTNGTANSVYSQFIITPTFTEGDTLYLKKDSYKDKISLSYRFLAGTTADYITMAGSCRELLIRQGQLRDTADIDDTSYPFSLTLITDTAEMGQTTTLQEAEELISSLITKGIRDISIILSGESSDLTFSLSDFAKQEGLKLSTEEKLFSASAGHITALNGEKADISTRNITDSADALIGRMRKSASGICISGGADMLLTDYGITGKSRKQAQDEISQVCTTLSSHGSLTVSKGNIYTLKYADRLINIPLTSPLEENTYCTSVPFLQAVLHGICSYSFTPLNLSSDPAAAMLKSIEYGAVPHYEWYFSSQGENDSYHYMSSLAEARLLYENMKNMFSDLQSQRITSHEQVKENVMRTVYSSGSEIYVNYNNKAVSVSGITLDPMGFMRVN